MPALAARTVSVRAQAQRPAAAKPVSVKAQKPNFAQAAAAVFTAAALFAAPAYQAMADEQEKVRPAVCASNPTAKICLRGSFERSQAK